MSDRNYDNLRNKLITRTSDLIDTRRQQISWLRTFIEDVKEHELIINVAKTGTTVVTVLSAAALFFPPTAILGAVGLAGSGVVGGTISIADFISNKIKSKDLKKMIEKSQEQEGLLKDAYKQLRTLIEKVARELNLDSDTARALVLHEGVARTVKYVYDVANGAIRIADLVPKLMQIRNVMQFGYGFLDAGFVASGTGLAMVVEGGEAVYQITGSAISTTAKVFAGVGVAISVGDLIYSWANDNPNLASAKTCLGQVEDNLKELKSSLKVFKKMPN